MIAEHRIFGSSIRLLEKRDWELKPNPDGLPVPTVLRLGGYAARFNSRSQPLGFEGFREVIDPAAFDETLASNPDVRFTMNHDPSRIFGRTKSGTLRVAHDEQGLNFEVDLPDTPDAQALVTAVNRGDISQCSFAFRTLQDDWAMESDGTLVRTLLRLDLNHGDVSAVTYPAYEETEVEVRSAFERGRERLALRGWQRAAQRRTRELLLMEVE